MSLFTHTLATLVALVVPGLPDDFWANDVSDAIERAARETRWVLVYFPSPDDADDPVQVRRFAPGATLEKHVLGARVRGDDVVRLLERYEIYKLPALVMLDPYGGVQRRWSERWSIRDVRAAALSGHRRLVRRLEELDRKLELAREALAAGDHATAIGLCREVIGRSSSGFPQRGEVALILGRVLRDAERELLELLALEGIISDRRLGAALEKLGERYEGLPPFDARIDRERRRLRGRRIGGA